MLDILRRVAIVLLLLLLLSTVVLYLFANIETVSAFSQRLVSPVVTAVQSMFARPPETEPQPTNNEPKYEDEQPPPVIEPFEEPTEPAEAVETDLSELPYFIHENMLNLVPDEVERIIYILASETEGNLWLAESANGRWHTQAGPMDCRIGSEGLRRDKHDGDASTPIGWFVPSYLYSSRDPGASWPLRAIDDGYVWVTDSNVKSFNTVVPAGYEDYKSCTVLDAGGAFLDLGYNRSRQPGRGGGVFLYGSGDMSLATSGSVALSTDDMERVLEWLDVGKYTVVGIFRAETAAWEIQHGLPGGFSFLTDAVPSAREDARYASEDNFLGRPLDGYIGARVVVSDQMATALRKVQQKLEESGLGILVYDSYRPQRAVDDIFRWLDTDEPGNKEKYYPELDKSALSGRYLAEYSLHRLAAAVDLTICDLETGEPLDMGTGFDYFSPSSAYGSLRVSREQRANRKLLRDTMIACGFSSYDGEWWHFNLDSAASKGTAYDFVIPQ